jgi:hypothetical protein
VPRYFFHVADGHIFCDDVGTELPSLVEARREAIATFGDLVKNRDEWKSKEWRIVIADAEERILLTLNMSVEEVYAEAA